MKKNNILLTLSCIVLIVAGCSQELDIKPKDSVTEDQALDSPEAIQSLLVGAYDRMADDDVYGGWIQMTSDLLGTNFDITWNGTFSDPGDIWSKAMTSNNGQAEVTWTETYEAINVTNIVLANLDVVTDEDEKSRIEGEAKFIRGTMYFELVRLFAKDWADGDPAVNLGVPLKLTPTDLNYNPAVNFISRATVAEVYDQVFEDLNTAEELLANLDGNGFYATVWAAKAVLARVYMQQRDYDNARIKANEVIESGQFSLVDRIDRAFNQANNSVEDIFAIQVTNQDGENALQTFYAATAYNGRRDIRIRPEYEALFEEDDQRLQYLIYYDVSGRRLSGKYKDQFANISIIRLAEMYLLRAEANLLAGGTQVGPNTPGDDLQLIRARAKASDAPANPTLDDILLERKRELGFEGQFIHDIRRTETTIEQLGTYAWNDDVLVLPIPQREVDANPSLKGQQNPGYGN
ncbi:MAG TPA: RagB/SusD family nutrient uptake outer membrane protein [Ohtaekwangia sp.]|uniref:RagB/SusD family nutrient uptake outer membrane protein n=1 Tax=Ohtaekwangia sp. TaxID=2066019 RepID=UPI002F9441AB